MLARGLAPSSFRGRLFLILIAFTTLPLVLTAYVFFYILNANVADETTAKLAFVRDAKRSEIHQYLSFAFRQAEALTKSNAVRYSIGDFYGFSYAFRQIDDDPDAARSVLQHIFGITEDAVPGGGPMTTDTDAMFRNALEYSNAHQRFNEEYASFIRSAEFDNLYLVNTDGRVVYSVEKDFYLGGDMSEDLRESDLGRLNRLLLESGEPIVVADFGFDPLTGVHAAYVAVRVEFYQRFRGAAIFRLPARGLDAIVQTRDEDQSGSFFLLSSEDAVISSPDTSPLTTGQQVDARVFADAPSNTARISDGLTDGAALAAWTSVDFHDLGWTLAAEVPTRTAFAKSEALTIFVAIIAAIGLPILFWLALLLSRTMTAPLQKLIDVSESIAAGDLDRTMPAIERPTELGRLNESFKRMRNAIRAQLGLIGQKNVELERHLKLIEEKNAALEEADRLKDTFVANTSHELRTPLNGIIGISETLSAGAVGELSPAQRSQLELITFSARRLSRLVDDLLDLYRIRQGRMRLDIHPVHVATSIRNVLQVSEPLLRGEPVQLDVDIPETLPYVMTDPVRFEQILYNLLGNAIKYTDQGSITIKAWRAGGTVAVAVIDTGIGIAPENLERIFQPLERGEGPEIVQKPGSAGLGLTIARQLATVMNGRLSAESRFGEGSQFMLELPVAEGVAEAEIMASVDRAEALREPIGMLLADTGPGSGPSPDDAPLILIVDDEPVNIQVLRNVLIPQGYAVRSAENGIDALAAVEKRKPDLIVLDVMMPNMGGLEVARRLRDRHSLLDLPIIMVTARSRTRDVIAGFEHGANDYVVKPFVKDELLARIATLLEAGRARVAARENIDLKHEIERRVQVEDALRLSQQRMTRLLDALQAGLVCFNETGRATYANQAASVYAGRVIEPGVTMLTDILTPTIADAMTRTVASEGRAVLEDVPLGLPARTVLLNAFELDVGAGGGIAIVITPDSDETRQASDLLVRSVQGVIDTVGPALVESAAKPAIPAALVEDADPTGREYYRETIVSVVSQSLALWRRVTGRSKIDFAEQSGVWRVNLDRSSLQSRTFDKYLLIETLPANPRWRDVIQTAEFALSETEAHLPDSEIGALHAELKVSTARLRDYVKENILPRPKTETQDVTTSGT